MGERDHYLDVQHNRVLCRPEDCLVFLTCQGDCSFFLPTLSDLNGSLPVSYFICALYLLWESLLHTLYLFVGLLKKRVVVVQLALSQFFHLDPTSRDVILFQG
jgi:hypothetical protein